MADDTETNTLELETLIANYRADVKLRVAALEEAWRSLREDNDDISALQTMIAIAHQLAGSSALFGFDALSQSALQLERSLDAIADGTSTVGGEAVSRMDAFVAEAEQAVNG